MLENKKWFQATCSLAGMVIAWGCWFLLRPLAAHGSSTEQLALVVLVAGALHGWGKFMMTFAPLVLVLLFPRLDR
jgi:hypothetical protein